MLDEPSDKLQKAGDAMFAKDDRLQAMRFYKGAAAQAKRHDMKSDQTENPVYAYVAKKFLQEANRILDEAKASSGTNDYKRGEMARAKALLNLIQEADSESINKLLIDARREEDKGLHTFDADNKVLESAKRELARVEKSLDEAKNGKIVKPATDNTEEVRGAANPEKVAVWEKQQAIRAKKVADAQKAVDGYDKRITLDPSLKGGQLLDAYIRSYVGPLLPDVVPQKMPEETYTPMPPPVEARPAPWAEPRQRVIDVRSGRPETLGQQLVTIPYAEYLRKDIQAQGAEAHDFLRTHLTRDINAILETLWNMPNSSSMRYVIQPGDTIESVARSLGSTVAVVRSKLGGRPLAVDNVLTFAPTEIDPHISAYKAYITIAEPYLEIQASALARNLPASQILQQFRAFAANRPIKIQGREYQLNFER